MYPHFEEYLLEYWPKKDCPARLVKCHEKIELLVVNNEPLFFKQRDGPWLPNLHVLHRFPFMLPIQIVDKGAIKFILSGAHIMCPGITSPGAFLNHDTPKGTPVQVSTVLGWTGALEENLATILLCVIHYTAGFGQGAKPGESGQKICLLLAGISSFFSLLCDEPLGPLKEL